VRAFKHCGPNPKPLTENEAIALAEIAKTLSANPIIIQIGAYIGASTIALLETRQDATIFSVDIKPSMQEIINVAEAGLDTNRVIRLLGDSGNIGKHFPYQCDLLFFDGDHREAGIRRDIETWLHTAKGSIAFHDYILDNPPARNQVAKVVDEMINLPTRLQVERLKVFETLDCRKS